MIYIMKKPELDGREGEFCSIAMEKPLGKFKVVEQCEFPFYILNSSAFMMNPCNLLIEKQKSC